MYYCRFDRCSHPARAGSPPQKKPSNFDAKMFEKSVNDQKDVIPIYVFGTSGSGKLDWPRILFDFYLILNATKAGLLSDANGIAEAGRKRMKSTFKIVLKGRKVLKDFVKVIPNNFVELVPEDPFKLIYAVSSEEEKWFNKKLLFFQNGKWSTTVSMVSDETKQKPILLRKYSTIINYEFTVVLPKVNFPVSAALFTITELLLYRLQALKIGWPRSLFAFLYSLFCT